MNKLFQASFHSWKGELNEGPVPQTTDLPSDAGNVDNGTICHTVFHHEPGRSLRHQECSLTGADNVTKLHTLNENAVFNLNTIVSLTLVY